MAADLNSALRTMKLTRTQLLIKLGEAKARYRSAWRLIAIMLPEPTRAQAPRTQAASAARGNTEAHSAANFAFHLDHS